MILSAYKAALLMSRTLYTCRENSTNVERTLQITPFLCKTNPISTEAKTNLTLYIKKVYENFIPPRTMKNEPKTNPKRTQFKPNSLNDKSNATFCVAKVYENKPPQTSRKNEPKTNPIPPLPNSLSSPIAHPPQYAIRHTQYEIRNTKYDIRNTRYEIRFVCKGQLPLDDSPGGEQNLY